MATFWLIAGLCVPVFSQSDPDHDFQIWNENTLVVPAFKRTKDGKQTDLINLLILQTNRFGGEGIQPIDERIGLGADVIVNKYLTFSPSYLYRASRYVPTVWDYEHRIRFDTTVGYNWAHIGIRNRNRIERRIRNSNSDSTRYRNRTQLRIPISRGHKTLFHVFGTIEPFYDVTAKLWTQYEFASGITLHPTDAITADLFYLHRGEIRLLPQTVNGFGVNVRVRFGK